MPEDLSNRANDLTEAVKGLTVAVNEMGHELQNLDSRVKRNRRAVAWIATSLALDVLLTVIVTLSLIQQDRLAQAQRDTTLGALCPLYSYLLNAYHPELQAPEKLAKYNEGYDVIRRGAVALKCNS